MLMSFEVKYLPFSQGQPTGSVCLSVLAPQGQSGNLSFMIRPGVSFQAQEQEGAPAASCCSAQTISSAPQMTALASRR